MSHKAHNAKTMLEIPATHRSHEVAASARQFAACPLNGIMGTMVALGPDPVSRNVVLLTMIMVFDEMVEICVVEPVGTLSADTMGEMTGMVDEVELTVNVLVPTTVEVIVVVFAVVERVVVVTIIAGIAVGVGLMGPTVVKVAVRVDNGVMPIVPTLAPPP